MQELTLFQHENASNAIKRKHVKNQIFKKKQNSKLFNSRGFKNQDSNDTIKTPKQMTSFFMQNTEYL